MNTRSGLPEGGTVCVYCGGIATTDDHTPPRCLLRRPLPSTLITLRACAPCNSGFSFDESVVRMVLASVSSHPELVAEAAPGGRVWRALARDARLRGIRDRSARQEGGFTMTEELLGSFRKVLFKTVQGLFYSLYGRVADPKRLALVALQGRNQMSREQMIDRFRPSALEDIADGPVDEISPSSWHVRQPVMVVKLKPLSGDGATAEHIFRIKRETKVEWVELQQGIFSFAFAKNDGADSICVMELWETLVVAVSAPWPEDRGPLRKGRNNPLSRE